MNDGKVWKVSQRSCTNRVRRAVFDAQMPRGSPNIRQRINAKKTM